jgi:uncharacterized membrane protein YecN with MAPEG domain
MTTSLYAGILAIALILLSINVIKSRQKFKVALGDDNNPEIKKRIRAQANFVEYAPMFILLLGITEYNHMPSYLVHLFGIFFFIGRALHAHSMLTKEIYVDGKLVGNPSWRVSGMKITFACIGLLAIVSISQYLLSIL